MDDTKYLIRADVVTAGVVERNDVVGAIYGQTEGLLGDELDLRDLQQTARVGRIDVEIESDHGRSAGQIEIETRLDKVEAALLAAALESIDQIGPCEASIEIDAIEDVRATRRREVAERAKELLDTSFEAGLDGESLIDEVREHVRTGRITEYEGLPAGPRVATGDAIIVVEGRADVLTLLSHGVKNAIAVEGTDVPDAVAELTRERTATAFFDGDRGGDLILRELEQVGELDYVAFAPEGRAVEDLERREVYETLREKVPLDVVLAEREEGAEGEATEPAEAAIEPEDAQEAVDPDDGHRVTPTDGGQTAAVDADGSLVATGQTDGVTTVESDNEGGADGTAAKMDSAEPQSLGDHVEAVITGRTGMARLLDGEMTIVEEVPVEAVTDAIEEADPAPTHVLVDGECDQRILDVAAQYGVGQVIARETGSFVKRPADVRVRTADEFS